MRRLPPLLRPIGRSVAAAARAAGDGLARLLPFARAIGRLNERVGRAVAWCALAMVLVGAWNALARQLDRYLIDEIGTTLASNTYFELQWYLFSLVFLLAAGYALRRDAHVRVDVFYGRLSPRGRAWIDLVGSIVFLLPFCALVLWASWGSVAESWRIREVSPDPGGLPRYPIKAAIPVGFVLLGLQGLAVAIERAAFLRGAITEEGEPRAPERGGEEVGRA